VAAVAAPAVLRDEALGLLLHVPDVFVEDDDVLVVDLLLPGGFPQLGLEFRGLVLRAGRDGPLRILLRAH
jgi:hypothetical protein